MRIQYLCTILRTFNKIMYSSLQTNTSNERSGRRTRAPNQEMVELKNWRAAMHTIMLAMTPITMATPSMAAADMACTTFS